jgi:DNA-binding MarR family transcriptional regulator
MGLTRQAVQRLANEMVDDGLLYSKANPKHKRAKLLALTKKGEEVFEKLEKKQTLWINSIAEGLKAEDLELTSSVLQKLAGSFRP